MLIGVGNTVHYGMTKPVNTILFDMDNTLFDFAAAQLAACKAVAAYLGRQDGASLFNDFFTSGQRGYESIENIRDYLRFSSIPEENAFQPACRVYEQVKLDHVVPYETVPETLSSLHDDGYKMAVITDAHSRDAARRLERAGLMPFFDGMVTFDMVMVRKPAPEPFLTALDMMKSGAETSLLVGDSPPRDLCPARELGIRTVYAKYGDRYADTHEFTEADFTINRMDELLQVIGTLCPE